MLKGEEYSPCYMDNSHTTMRKKRSINKKRFSDEQIKSLESIFESESRLEPRKKLQLARELGLQPRQVAIWFQNKRARWKSKQLEREYSVLQANYNSLASQFEALKKEKQALVIQLQKLNDLMHKSQEESLCCRPDRSANSIDLESDSGDAIRCECEANPSLPLERSEQALGVLSDDDSSFRTEYFGLEEPNLMNMVDPVDGSSTSPKELGNLDTNNLFDQSSSSYQWWDFWS